MNQLTDLELCKKIAAIEGVNVSIKKTMSHKEGICQRLLDDDDCSYWPLIDKDSIFDLMVKHKVTINYSIRSVTNDDHHTSFEFASEAEIPRAILECIIEDNRKVSNE